VSWRWTIGWLALACGPSAEKNAETTDNGSSGVDDSADDGVVLESSSTGASSTETSADEPEGSSTDAPLDPCAAGTPPECPEGCVEATVYALGDDDADCTASNPSRCVSGSFAPSPRTTRTFYRGDEFVVIGSACGNEIELEGWDECDLVGADDPPGCACFCREGVCPGDEDWLVLQECRTPELCPPFEFEIFGPIDPDAAACILTALRDRAAGEHSITWRSSYVEQHTVTFLDGSESVQIVQHLTNDVLDCPGDESGWEPAEHCTLAAPETFDSCLTETDPKLLTNCLIPEMTWFIACEPTAPTCD
jgi:hypothetical protein